MGTTGKHCHTVPIENHGIASQVRNNGNRQRLGGARRRLEGNREHCMLLV